VRRRWSVADGGSVAVDSVDDSAAVQAQSWDLLYLKGHGWRYGLGAVHRSPPEASVAHPRLLLTIDDTDACACCN
jgi:hypothetical protein